IAGSLHETPDPVIDTPRSASSELVSASRSSILVLVLIPATWN
ncbi:MAG: hypothetical protein XD86_0799, partial [Mesotoga infera]